MQLNTLRLVPPFLFVDRDSKEALLEIRDQGLGISVKDLPHIFELFTSPLLIHV